MTSPSSHRGRRLLALCLALAAPALVGLVAAPAGAATSPKPVWVATSSGSGGRAAAGRVVVRDPGNGAVYVAGSAGVSAKAGEIMVVKYDAAGASQWTATYRRAGAGAQTAVAGALDKAGDFVVLCAVRGARTGVDWAVLEYAPNGTMNWATVIAGRGHGNDVPSRLALAPTGAIYAAGALVAEHGELDAAVVKLTAAGKVSWKRSVAGPGNGADRFSALGLDGAGRVFCAGGHGQPRGSGSRLPPGGLLARGPAALACHLAGPGASAGRGRRPRRHRGRPGLRRRLAGHERGLDRHDPPVRRPRPLRVAGHLHRPGRRPIRVRGGRPAAAWRRRGDRRPRRHAHRRQRHRHDRLRGPRPIAVAADLEHSSCSGRCPKTRPGT